MAGGPTGDRPAALLESKLQVPRVLGTAVRRDHLLSALAMTEQRGRVVTVVSAPAGVGKTMLLAQRTEQLRSAGAPVAWLSLDNDDNESRMLWSGILEASRRAAYGVDESASHAFAALRPPVTTIDDGLLGAYFDVVDRLPDGLWLVLDDVHEIDAATTLAGLARLLTQAPPKLRLMLGCRYDPPLPIPRMILEDRAAEIRAADLAFSRDETRRLLRGLAIELTDGELDLLVAKTEGWAAGLTLAALALARGVDARTYLDAMVGDDRAVAAYLVSEVLDHQPADIVEFLLATSIPEWLTADLAAELSQRVDAGTVLDGLARENALVFQRDTSPRTYRYHTLLRSYLLAEHRRRDGVARRELHRVASDWYVRHGDLSSALDHAAAAHDDERVAAIVSRHGLRLIMQGKGPALARALDTVGDDVLATPPVALVAAMSALLGGDTWSAKLHLDRMGRDTQVHRQPWLRLLHATVILYDARLRDDPPTDIAALADFTRTNTVTDPDLELLAALTRGITMIGLGDPIAADADLADALAMAREHGRDYIALECLGYSTLSAAAMSDFANMSARAEAAIKFATVRGWASAGPMVRIYLAAGWAAWQRMDVAAAERHVTAAADIEADVEDSVRFGLDLLATYVEFAKNRDRQRLRDRLRKLWLHPDATALTPKESSTFCLLELRTALATAHDDWADEVVARVQHLLAGTADLAVLLSMVHAHHGRNTIARRTLKPSISGTRACVGINAQITAWLLEAHLAAVGDDRLAAKEAATQAIRLAAPRGALRLVVMTASRHVHALLRAQQGTFGPGEEFVAEVLAAIEGTDHGTLFSGDALTARELELLRDLPSLLTLEEIAAAHVVSVNTVKTHLRALYRKLDVAGRRAAVERASELGLL